MFVVDKTYFTKTLDKVARAIDPNRPEICLTHVYLRVVDDVLHLHGTDTHILIAACIPCTSREPAAAMLLPLKPVQRALKLMDASDCPEVQVALNEDTHVAEISSGVASTSLHGTDHRAYLELPAFDESTAPDFEMPSDQLRPLIAHLLVPRVGTGKAESLHDNVLLDSTNGILCAAATDTVRIAYAELKNVPAPEDLRILVQSHHLDLLGKILPKAATACRVWRRVNAIHLAWEGYDVMLQVPEETPFASWRGVVRTLYAEGVSVAVPYAALAKAVHVLRPLAKEASKTNRLRFEFLSDTLILSVESFDGTSRMEVPCARPFGELPELVFNVAFVHDWLRAVKGAENVILTVALRVGVPILMQSTLPEHAGLSYALMNIGE